MRRALPLVLACAAACGGEESAAPEAMDAPPEPAAAEPVAPEPAPEVEPILVELPGGEQTLQFLPVTLADGSAFWIARTETTWDVFDLFFLRPDEEAEVDGITGPSKSVFPVTRGWGHDGMPAIGMTYASAQAFCDWLNGKGLDYAFRLPTAEEWRQAAGPDPEDWDAAAWHAGNTEDQPRAVAGKARNAWGLYDMAGNVAEWVATDEVQPVALGGSYRQEPPELGRDARMQYDLSWQQRDPQWPKSSWWMSDAGWVGFRLVLEERP